MAESVSVPVTEAPPSAPVVDAPPVVDAGRPEWLPAKFKDAEQMAQSYIELEKRLGGGQPAPEPAPTPEPAPAPAPAPAADPAAADAQIEAIAKEKNFDLTPYRDEFAKTGGLSPESIEKIAAGGVPKQFIVDYVAGVNARAAQVQTELYGVVGGKEAWDTVRDWAQAGGLSKAEIDAFDAGINGGNHELTKITMRGVLAQYERANGKVPALLQGGPGNGAQDSFKSHQEHTAAIRDPRYAKDPAYRAQVIAKLSRSSGLYG